MPSLIHANDDDTNNNNSNKRQPQHRIILLLDLDSFYAQTECVRLGYNAAETSLALLQWNSVLAVTYPARRFGIQRGDSWQAVQEKSNGQCLAVHVPILSTTTSNTSNTTVTTASNRTGNDTERDDTATSPDTTTTTTTTIIPASLQSDYDSIFVLTPAEREAARLECLGQRKHSHQGKACIERYRVASGRIFETVQAWLAAQSATIVLERASIDEFFLDVTAACYDSSSNNDNDIDTTELSPWSIDGVTVAQALAKTVRIGPNNKNDSSSNNKNNTDWPDASFPEDDMDLVALRRGCAVALAIRQAVMTELGFTLSAGVSTNKTLAKLSASYGKPAGQAVTEPDHTDYLLQQTQLKKCRNLGGKLGSKVQALLPAQVPTTVHSIARYLSLPDLQQGLRDAATAAWVFDMARGIDKEVVAPKTDTATAMTKSITAFKALPFVAGGHRITQESTVQWIQLLAEEVVMRVEQDAGRNSRYPRSCSIHYAAGVQPTEDIRPHRKASKSLRTHFPPQRLAVAQRIADLTKRVPALIRDKEGDSFTIHRVGLCAIDFLWRESNNAIESYFTTSTATASAAVTTTSQSNKGATEIVNPEEHRTTIGQEVREYCPVSSVAATSKDVTPAVSADMEMALKLQASYDREHRVLQVMDKKGAAATTRRPPKTRRIDSFFTKR